MTPGSALLQYKTEKPEEFNQFLRTRFGLFLVRDLEVNRAALLECFVGCKDIESLGNAKGALRHCETFLDILQPADTEGGD